MENREHIQKVSSISDVKSDNLSESVLEELFLSKLQQISTTWKPVMTSRGHGGYSFEVIDANKNRHAYELEQQVELTSKENVEVYSKADFIIYPIKNKKLKPIVVFTDGFSFHEERIDTDSAQRMAIVRSHNYISWSLTWEDIDEFGKKKPQYKYTDFLDEKYLGKYKDIHKEGTSFLKKTNMELLIELLSDSNLNSWSKRAEAISTSMIKAPYDINNTILQKSLSEELYSSIFNEDTKYFAGTYDDSDVSILSLGDFTKLSKNDFTKNIFIVHLKDKFTRIEFKSWAGILRMYNLLQFLECSLFTTQKGIDDALYDVIDFHFKSSDTNADWSLVYEDVLDEAKTLVKALSKNNEIPLPNVGEEIVDDNDTVLGEAELVWNTFKVAVTIDEHFEAKGWTMFKADEVEQIIETILQRIAS